MFKQRDKERMNRSEQNSLIMNYKKIAFKQTEKQNALKVDTIPIKTRIEPLIFYAEKSTKTALNSAAVKMFVLASKSNEWKESTQFVEFHLDVAEVN